MCRSGRKADVTATTVRFFLYDASRKQWRAFFAEPTYQARCGNALHQFALGGARCACGQIANERQG